MKFLEKHWWVIAAIVVLWMLANASQSSTETFA